ncbi:MAG: hypothetical protein DRR08_17280 [Candidatus Parabeggiatoa sp. nov. 2]|nr:MAG: hypothetical protein B6247_06470 [Beggiatoa sp. 4572_84]RKZ58099.1 MAG: hypothetical protein DRR08_17280 [Gammaproteobacteria bacterium]
MVLALNSRDKGVAAKYPTPSFFKNGDIIFTLLPNTQRMAWFKSGVTLSWRNLLKRFARKKCYPVSNTFEPCPKN